MDIRPNPPLAAALTLLASALVACTSLLAKVLGTDTLGPALHPLQVSQGRFVFALLTFSMAALVLRPRFTRPELPVHVLRVFFGWGGSSFLFAAAAFIPLSDAMAISFLNPVVAMVLALVVLHEKVGPWRIGASVVAVAGAMILLRPTPDAFQPAALLAVGAALFLGAELVVVKRLSGREGLFQILLLNNLIGSCIASAAAVWFWRMPTPEQWAALLALGGIMAVAQTCFLQALRRADASFVSPFFYGTLIFAALYDFLLFGERPDAISALGALIIVAGAATLAWREALNGRRARLRPSDASRSETAPMPQAAPLLSPPKPPQSQDPEGYR